MKKEEPATGAVAAVVQRLAVLLAAGVPPAAAWGYLEHGELTGVIADRALEGGSIAAAIVESSSIVLPAEQTAWRGLAAAWAVATDAGAPLAPTLRDFAVSLRDLAEVQRDVGAALAAPLATARLVLALPIVGLLFGSALGFNTLATLTTTPIGWACLALGTVLLIGAAAWNRRLVRGARPRDLVPGLDFDLMAIAVSGGSSIDRARGAVDSALQRHAGRRAIDDSRLDAILELSRRAGVPAADLLRSEATECRREARARLQIRVNRLTISLMLPLGLCVLPAFMVLSVVPLLVTVFTSTRLG
jgi:tight adherence protein B